MKQRIFIDTNFLCALYNQTDSQHLKAIQIEPALKSFDPVLSNFILLEVYTILSQRISKKFAIAFGNHIRHRHPYTLIWINRVLENKVWRIFSSIKNKNFSYVDASTLALIQQEEINHLLSFDSSFKKFEKEYNFKVI